MEKHRKRFGVRMDQMERERKREARKVHKVSEFAQKAHGLRAKLFNQKRFKEKATLRKTLALHQEGSNKHSAEDQPSPGREKIFTLINRFLMLNI
jgi:ribosome biogenesis protein NSA2